MTQQVPVPYHVQAGETLSSIAKQEFNNDAQPYRMAIYRENQSLICDDPNVIIHPELELWIPSITDSLPDLAKKIGDRFYIVQAGDTLSSIAQQVYNDDSQPYLKAIKSLNQSEIGADPNVINPGEALYLPPINIHPQQDSYYIVQAGDTLPSIAQQAYGDPNLWPLIFSDNRKVFHGGDLETIFSVNPPEILVIKVWPKGGNIH